MFHDIPTRVLNRMNQLEERDARDRTDGTPRSERLRQIPPDTGRLLALLAATGPDGTYLEIGTSAGYSALWLALACREKGRSLTTFEHDETKAALARETFTEAGVEDVVNLIQGDARDHLDEYDNIAFCFLDAEKENYGALSDMIVPRMLSGGLLVADNVISHARELQPWIDRMMGDDRVDAAVIPIGKGELLCRVK